MEVTECKNNVKCDLGGCKNRATHTIKFDRAVRNRVYACERCLTELYDAIGGAIMPKSVETAKRKNKDSV